MSDVVLTIGHSTYDLEDFVELLKQHRVSAVCDIRSQPYSRRNPQFNSEALKRFLLGDRISYVFLGRELGARSEDPSCYIDGKVQYDRIAKTDLFQIGLQSVREQVRTHRVALMCAEKDPLECHRTILVGRYLDALGIVVDHILETGELESQERALDRLVRRLYKDHENDLFRSPAEMIEDAYAIQSARIAYEETRSDREIETVGSHFG